MIMGLFGIIIASLVNLFVRSRRVQFGISVIGVLVFTGLTAYDTQRIKADYIHYGYGFDGEMSAKRSVYRRAVSLPQLHQPLPDDAADHGQS